MLREISLPAHRPSRMTTRDLNRLAWMVQMERKSPGTSDFGQLGAGHSYVPPSEQARLKWAQARAAYAAGASAWQNGSEASVASAS